MIVSGQKDVEFRKVFKGRWGNTVYLVCEKKVHGYFKAGGIGRCQAQHYHVMPLSSKNTGITSDELVAYAGDPQKYISAIDIKKYHHLDQPIPIEEFGISKSPQNYCFARRLPQTVVENLPN